MAGFEQTVDWLGVFGVATCGSLNDLCSAIYSIAIYEFD